MVSAVGGPWPRRASSVGDQRERRPAEIGLLRLGVLDDSFGQVLEGLVQCDQGEVEDLGAVAEVLESELGPQVGGVAGTLSALPAD
jgi:hypothetical protein